MTCYPLNVYFENIIFLAGYTLFTNRRFMNSVSWLIHKLKSPTNDLPPPCGSTPIRGDPRIMCSQLFSPLNFDFEIILHSTLSRIIPRYTPLLGFNRHSLAVDPQPIQIIGFHRQEFPFPLFANTTSHQNWK